MQWEWVCAFSSSFCSTYRRGSKKQWQWVARARKYLIAIDFNNLKFSIRTVVWPETKSRCWCYQPFLVRLSQSIQWPRKRDGPKKTGTLRSTRISMRILCTFTCPIPFPEAFTGWKRKATMNWKNCRTRFHSSSASRPAGRATGFFIPEKSPTHGSWSTRKQADESMWWVSRNCIICVYVSCNFVSSTQASELRRKNSPNRSVLLHRGQSIWEGKTLSAM